MKKFVLISAFFTFAAIVSSGAQSQDSHWVRQGVAGATLSQVSLSNWAAGGEGSVAYNLMFNYDADYKNGRHLWDNRIELAYGMTWSQSKGQQKNNDRIFLSSMYGYEIGNNWYFSALGTFRTQFANGFDYGLSPKHKISRFMAPGYLSFGLGFTWKPNDWFSAMFSPLTWRGTFVLDDDLFWDANGNPISAFGVKHGKHFLNELGANVRLEVNRNLTQNINLYSRLDLFSNYLHKPGNIDVHWDVVLSAALTRWLSANLTLNMVYDDDVKFPRKDGSMGSSKFQIREIFGLGLQTTF